MNYPIVAGDILRIYREEEFISYWHWGVYVGDSQVIHFSNAKSDTSSDNEIINTHLKKFFRNAKKFQVVDFSPKGYKEKYITKDIKIDPWNRFISNPSLGLSGIMDLYDKISGRNVSDYKIYSPKEVVERARSRLGEKNYSLLTNNCEHFAVWCKTGVKGSKQVEGILETIFGADSNKKSIYIE
ncbi:hypothetical protein P256_00244 [Acinetobacter nectaris CIP 110549]|uniref:LRAT domain-containing protein n=1 Tax=Acinetobacter nectaris CIP 110549 TaxID=1392540 RepID=V2TZA1_9GAMM|nr:lecithin retinol acyltransferase family protein [Acinetobacter nectaris]ESK41255.1 hypothetical protein P256_00244 [Acinetobacter nectaris CIP 110549]